MATGVIIEVIVMIMLIFLSAFFSGIETALTSMTKLRIKQLLSKENKKAEVINIWVKKSDKLLITILVGNNIVNIGAASMGALVVDNLFAHASMGRAIAISWFTVTFLILTFGEIIPKSVARKHAEGISIFCLPYLRAISIMLTPVNKIFTFIVRIFMRIIGSDYQVVPAKITEEEIKTFVDVGEKEGVIPRDEKELIHSIFEFGDKIVREIMTPRVDIIAVAEDEPVEAAKNIVKKTLFSKIPVYGKDMDDMKGIFYAKDLIAANSSEDFPGELKLADIMREVLFVPETKRISALMKEMQKKKVHIAIVLDEYGGTAGLVTLEDIIEEIVGEIQDEFDTDENYYTEINENEYIFDAKMSIDEANEYLSKGARLPESENYDTIGGFIIAHLGKIPRKGEKIAMENLSMEIVDADDKSVKKVKVTGKKEE
ncbi:MAG: HlyC/CorC family transporter [Candidatus Aureabacteria bacterium]|nr:HlyC/CorC family transporter [Candidatus Auribacterota bacterium]